MRSILLTALLLPSVAFAQLELVSVKPRFVTVTQQECEVQEVYVENTTGASIVGGVIGAAIGNEIGGGSGRKIATVAGAIAGANIGRTQAEKNGRLEYRNVCRDVQVQVKRGEYVTIRYNGQTFTQLFN